MRRTNIVSHLLGTRTRARAKAVAIYFCRLCVYNRRQAVWVKIVAIVGEAAEQTNERTNERPSERTSERNERTTNERRNKLRLSVHVCCLYKQYIKSLHVCVCVAQRGYKDCCVCTTYSGHCLALPACYISVNSLFLFAMHECGLWLTVHKMLKLWIWRRRWLSSAGSGQRSGASSIGSNDCGRAEPEPKYT